ncbi:hypothetical protein FRC06_003331 [Ceratobasidium sp. 370]|nr:hypothetical protein FRC06_003331 [Ceratobasidium sp. 370]
MPANDLPPRCPPCISRRRTSRCNRQVPCAACVRKNTQAECIAAAAPQDNPCPAPPSLDRPCGTRLRIDRATPTNPSVRTGTNSTRLSSIPDDYEDEDDDALPRDELRARLLELESSDAEDPPTPPKGVEKPAIPPAKPSLPVIVPGKLAPGILVVTPQPIVKVVKDGLASYVSLANLTDAACIAFAEGRIHNASAPSRNTAATGDNVPDYNELTLSSSTWNQGWKRYIALLEQFHPD